MAFSMLSPRSSQVRTMYQTGGAYATGNSSTYAATTTYATSAPNLSSHPPSSGYTSIHSNGYDGSGMEGHVKEYESLPMGDERGMGCRCFQDFSAKAPRVDPRELFVNVVIREIEDIHVVRNVHDWWQSFRGQMMGGGKNQYAGRISDNIFKENEFAIKAEVVKIFQKRGFLADVDNMLLPPSRGEPHPHTYLQLTRDALPIFLVFRVQLSERYERSSYHCGYRDCMHQAGVGSLTKLVEKRDSDAIGKELQESLLRDDKTNHLRPIKADVNVVDSSEEMHVLYNMHWSEDQAADAILQARRRRTGARHRMAWGTTLAVIIIIIIIIGVTILLDKKGGLSWGSKATASEAASRNISVPSSNKTASIAVTIAAT